MIARRTPKVSVVIPTYNRKEMLCQAIDSVLAQTYKNMEIIVVDDGSTDGTGDVIQERYGSKVKYFRQPNRGLSAARNHALCNASGEFIAFLDDDDLWLNNNLKRKVEFLQNYSDHAFVYSGADIIDGDGKITGKRTYDPEDETTFAGLRRYNFIWSPTLTVVRKTCLDNAGWFDEKLRQSSDYDLWLRLSKRYKFFYINEILCQYRLYEGNISKNWDVRKACHLRIFGKAEMTENLTRVQKRTQLAQVHYNFARLFYKHGFYLKAARDYTCAVFTYPLIGLHQWPKEVRHLRFTFIYRFLKVYYLILHCLGKQLLYTAGHQGAGK